MANMMATSASQYGSPYIYKEPPPKIKYPPMFSALNDITLKYVMDSKVLALATLLLIVSWIVCVAMTIMPFWFELVLDPLDGTFGKMQEKPRTVINSGLFYLREDHWDNLAFLNSYNNDDVVPKVLAFAQLCAVLGHCTLSASLFGAIILALRRFSSATGMLTLATGATIAAVMEVLSVVFCLLLVLQSSCDPADTGCDYHDNLAWHMIPMYTQMYRVEPTITPYVTVNWAFYIAVLGAILCIVSTVFLWVEALSTGRTLSGIRYQQLQQTIDPHEGDISPTDGRHFAYAEPDRYGRGFGMMQPVPGIQYPPAPEPSYAPRPSVGFGPAPTRGRERDYSDTTSFTESSVSERPVKQREINL